MASGPLVGLKVVEFAGIGPGPFCGMLLADLGADVVRIDRKGSGDALAGAGDILGRSKRSVALDLKKPDGVAAALAMVAKADALIEGFRPGVMERLGLGPDAALKANPRLVYGRMTGWGQTGPYAQTAGHDIDYIAIAGALGEMGRAGAPPSPPLNLVGDFGGGSLYLAFGICAALFEAARSGKGQVIDCAMTDGAASLMTMFHGMRGMGLWGEERDANLLDGGAHFYDTYECADGKFLALGAIEPQFHAEMVAKLGFEEADFPKRMNPKNWPAYSEKVAERVRTKTRDEWAKIFEGSDACVSPVLSMAEALVDPHNVARETFVTENGLAQPAPAPRFSRTAGKIQGPPPKPGEHTESAMADWGVSRAQILEWKEAGAI
jgi:alpha-methylacyl-CoA racemase